MALLDPKAARVTVTVMVLVGALGFLYLLRHVLLLVLLSLFLAHLIFPLVKLAQRGLPRRLGRTGAIALVYLGLLVGLGGVAVGVGPRLSRELQGLAERVPQITQQLQSGELLGSVLQQRGWEEARIAEVERAIRTHARDIIGYAQGAAAGVLVWLAGTWVVVLIPIFAFFILKDAERVIGGAATLIEGRRNQQFWRDVIGDLNLLLSGYVTALILLALVTFVVWSVAFLAAGVPYALVLAAIGGALEFIPAVGPLAAGVIVVSVSLFTGFEHPWLLAGFVLLWRGVQDYLSSPLIMGRGMEINPALVILGVIAGGQLAGVAGMFLSVPVIAAIPLLWRRYQAFRQAP